jgi:predicted permease
MPRTFTFPVENPPPALWISLSDDADGAHPKTSQRGFDSLDVVGRLKPGTTLPQAKADLSLIAANLAQQYSDSNKKYSSALVEQELDHIVGDTSLLLRILFGAVALVLLIACANVSGLLLARSSQRHGEFALRAAIGAGRAAIMRQLLVESVILSSCGGIAGVALAFALLQSLIRFMPAGVPRIEQAHIDGTALVFALAATLVTGMLCGVLPAWKMSQLEPLRALRDGSRNVSGGRKQHRLHNGLVVAQTAIGLVLLVGAGLLIRSFIHIMSVDPGFDPQNVLTARVGASFDKLSHDQHVRFYEDLLARLSSLPGVRSASAGWPLPMSNSNAGISFSIVGRPVAKGDEPSESLGTDMKGFFETMRIPLLSGRTFSDQDGTKNPPVVVINDAFARKYFPGENPLGKHIQPGLGDGALDHPVREVIGVVGDIKRGGLTANPEPQYYLPYPQAVITNPYLIIRTTGDPAPVEAALRAAVHELDSSVPVYQVSPLESYLSRSVAQPRFQTLLLSCFAWIALILTAIGLYGLLSYLVVQRSSEIALRMALGAQRADVLGAIVRRGLAVTLAGTGVGLVAAVLITRMLSRMLFGIKPYDPATFFTVTAVLLLTSLAASMVPAYRAARVDPMTTLKQQ